MTDRVIRFLVRSRELNVGEKVVHPLPFFVTAESKGLAGASGQRTEKRFRKNRYPTPGILPSSVRKLLKEKAVNFFHVSSVCKCIKGWELRILEGLQRGLSLCSGFRILLLGGL